MSCWMAGLVSILLAEGRSWKHMQLRCNLFFFLCTLLEYVCVCVCLLPYITHVPGGGVVVVSIVTLFQYNCSTVISAVFPHTHTHVLQSLESLWMNCEPWLRWMLLWGQQMCLFLPYTEIHSRTHKLTPGSVFISLHPLSIFPKATRPTYPQCTPAAQTRVN